MANRRSLGDALALTPDKVAFIHGATAKAATVVAEPVIEIPVKAEPVVAVQVQDVEEGEERTKGSPFSQSHSESTQPRSQNRQSPDRKRHADAGDG